MKMFRNKRLKKEKNSTCKSRNLKLKEGRTDYILNYNNDKEICHKVQNYTV